jgi:hypothetical protein
MRKRPMRFDMNFDIDKAQQGRETLSLRTLVTLLCF